MGSRLPCTELLVRTIVLALHVQARHRTLGSRRRDGARSSPRATVDDPAAREALAELCSAYWYPLYAFVRRKGHPPEEAADLVQGTFLTLLDRDGLAAVAPERGRFRSFLMAACAHHLADCRDRDRAAKRGGGRADSLRSRRCRRPLLGRAGR